MELDAGHEVVVCVVWRLRAGRPISEENCRNGNQEAAAVAAVLSCAGVGIV